MTAWTLLALALACTRARPPGEDSGGSAAGDEAVLCPTTFTARPATAGLDGVYLAGDWNDWDPEALPMEPAGDGAWTLTVDLPPGPHPYEFVETAAWDYGGYEGWTCDPEAAFIQCDDGAYAPGDPSWNHDCAPSTDTACNSMVIVPDCSKPRIEVTAVDIDRAGGSVHVEARAVASLAGGELSGRAVLDGEEIAGAFDGTTFVVDADGLAPTRHTLRLYLDEAGAGEAEFAHIPFWTDVTDPRDEGWRRGIVYFAFVDRLADGDPSLDASEGATLADGSPNPAGDYAGGDLDGLRALLPYLDDLGVTTLWISNMADNAEGAWGGDCGATFAGYHAYWPDAPRTVEEHFGDEDALTALVEAAHARNMRVIMDWVGNHVHEDHPYYADHADDWFHDYLPCKVGDDTSGFDEHPEDCWFASYLPDVDYGNPEPLAAMVDDALWWARAYDLDGLRVDAVKHMSHAVPWNLEARIRADIEHRDAGGDEEFWTVGETFDGADLIASYLHADNHDGTERLGLDGQFDFPMYYAILGAFATGSGSLADLDGALAAAEAAYGDALMSDFLGNHDVERFTTYAAEGYVAACQDDTTLASASAPADPAAYDRLRLAFGFLLTQPAVPLVYYGDEIGLPGYTDPDNRQPLWQAAGTLGDGGVRSVDDMAARLDEDPARVLVTVAALGRARREHPAFWRGEQVEWWAEWPDLWGYARVDPDTGDALLVVLNRSDADRTLTNGVAFAGLPEGSYTDVLTGDTFATSGDSLSVSVGAMDLRVLVAD